jgi:hypothetical protein
MKIGYQLAEHARKLVTHWLRVREKHFGSQCAFSEFYGYLCSLCHPFLCPLSHILCPCLTSLFLVSRSQYLVSRYLAIVSHSPFSVPNPYQLSHFLWLYSTVSVEDTRLQERGWIPIRTRGQTQMVSGSGYLRAIGQRVVNGLLYSTL